MGNKKNGQKDIKYMVKVSFFSIPPFFQSHFPELTSANSLMDLCIEII